MLRTSLLLTIWVLFYLQICCLGRVWCGKGAIIVNIGSLGYQFGEVRLDDVNFNVCRFPKPLSMQLLEEKANIILNECRMVKTIIMIGRHTVKPKLSVPCSLGNWPRDYRLKIYRFLLCILEVGSQNSARTSISLWPLG